MDDSIVNKYKDNPQEYHSDLLAQRDEGRIKPEEFNAWVTRLNEQKRLPKQSVEIQNAAESVITALYLLWREYEK